MHAELLGRVGYALPSDVAFSLADSLYLVEAGYCVSDMTGVDQGFFPLVREGELVVSQSVLLSPAQSFGHPDSSGRLTDLMPSTHLMPSSAC
jgi:hypothetical protein